MSMKQGYIYVMINSSYDGIVNIGKTISLNEIVCLHILYAETSG